MLDHVCPICEKENKCAINQDEPCWCTTYKFSDEANAVLKTLPKRCICSNCAEKLGASLK